MNKLILNEKQKNELTSLVVQIILKIRGLSHKPYNVNNMSEINELSDAIHNLPRYLVTNEPVDIGLLLSGFGIAGQGFYNQAKQILMKQIKIKFPKSDVEEFKCTDKDEAKAILANTTISIASKETK